MGRPKKDDDEKEKKVKKVKKVKDPNAPKRPISAYMHWLAENRKRLTKEGMSVADVAKLAGAEWRMIPDKSKWEEIYKKDKERYEAEIAEYNKSS
ncbi:unnamed protein product [Caenorhabditis bovis]|uniref:HMG box domain-containing protein n=1 Tax=Caenorhabditis bovis TaxID=2654633 RepID=A0A8S1EHI1_9PELO|nr:unnamed protein product [Caenorhabditis bovis]